MSRGNFTSIPGDPSGVRLLHMRMQTMRGPGHRFISLQLRAPKFLNLDKRIDEANTLETLKDMLHEVWANEEGL